MHYHSFSYASFYKNAKNTKVLKSVIDLAVKSGRASEMVEFELISRSTEQRDQTLAVLAFSMLKLARLKFVFCSLAPQRL